MKYIDADKLITEIKRLIDLKESRVANKRLNELLLFATSLQQEQPEVDLEKLGEIARHLIAVKDHEEDMRLTDDEWLLLERIGYSERFNARKEG